jgi:hypothetical protein
MDDRHLSRLVDEVERAFPGDPAAQGEAWEFLETFMADQAAATDAATDPAREQPTVLWRLIAACRELLQDAAGRVAGVVEDLVPVEPAFALGVTPGQIPSISIDAEASAELGVDPEITVEVGPDSVTLIATVDESSTPERLAAVLQTPSSPEAPDGEAIVRRFARLGSTLATAHFDITPTTDPLALALMVVDPDSA